MAYRAADQTGRCCTTRVDACKKKMTPSRLRKTDAACTVRSSGEWGGEECLITDAVSEIRCRRADGMPGTRKSNQLIRLSIHLYRIDSGEEGG